MSISVHSTSNLRLEVETTPAGLPNIFPDPDGSLGSWVLAPFTQNASSEPGLTSDGTKYTVQNLAGAANLASIITSYMPVVASSYVRIRYTVTAITASHQLVIGGVYWFDANKALITSLAPTLASGTGAVGTNYSQLSMQAPANAAYMWLQFSLMKGADAADNNASASFNQVMVTYAATSAAVAGSFAFTQPITWANILAPTHSIEIDRAALDVGTLSATVVDATLDPAVSATLGMGKAVRVQALVSGIWESIFEGSVLDAEVAYSRGPLGEVRTRIHLEAADNITALANTPDDAIWPTLARLPKIVEWQAPVPWKINGSTARFRNQTNLKPAAYEPDGNLLSSIAITRDSVLGYVWVDRRNVLTAYDRGSLPTGVQCAFTDVATGSAGSDYYLDRGLAVGFNKDEVINHVSLSFLRRSGAVEPAPTEEIPYGPYSDQASWTKNGPKAKTFKITAASEVSATIDALAATILTANKTPTRRASALTMPVKDTRSLGHAALLDLYDKVTVTFASILAAVPHRITSIKHTIETDRWSVQYGFSGDGTVAVPR